MISEEEQLELIAKADYLEAELNRHIKSIKERTPFVHPFIYPTNPELDHIHSKTPAISDELVRLGGRAITIPTNWQDGADKYKALLYVLWCRSKGWPVIKEARCMWMWETFGGTFGGVEQALRTSIKATNGLAYDARSYSTTNGMTIEYISWGQINEFVRSQIPDFSGITTEELWDIAASQGNTCCGYIELNGTHVPCNRQFDRDNIQLHPERGHMNGRSECKAQCKQCNRKQTWREPIPNVEEFGLL